MYLNFKHILFLLFPVLLFSQNTVRFSVSDENSIALSRAIFIISQNNSQVSFGTSNENGILEKKLITGRYDFKISKLGFTTLYKTVVIEKEQDFEFVLQEEVNKLKDVVIISRPKVMRINEDTISYNLKTILDGTENKVEDVIKRLPGLDIDQDGKVLYKGQQIDNVLVDGNEFFGKKHQMATQNINADMIEGIDLLTNYSGFAKASGGQKSIALNLKTKDSYKNKWISDLELAAGLNTSFRSHSNSFKFFKKGNLAIISDYNTIAKTPISREDYNEMRIVSEVDSENGEFKSFETPTFLNPNTFIKDKRNTFIGLNYTSLLGKRSKITVSNIFNKTKIAEENARLQTNIGESQSRYSFFENKVATSCLNNSSLKLEFNKSNTTFISYVAGFTPNVDEDNQYIIRSANQLDYYKSDTNFSFAHLAKVQTKLFKTIDYKGIVLHSIDDNRQKADLFSQQYLFGSTLDTINQKLKNQEVNFSLNNAFTITKKSNIFSLKINFRSHQAKFNNAVFENGTEDISLRLLKQSIQTNFSWLKSWNAKFQSILGFSSTTVNSSFEGMQNIFTRFEPNFSLIYNFKGLNKITLNYSLNHEMPSLSQLQQSDVVLDFQTISKPTRINFYQIISKKSFSLQYFSVNPQNQSVLFSNFSYDVETNSVSTNTVYNLDYVETIGISIRDRNSAKGLVLYDLKLNRFPLSIKTTLFYLKSIGVSQFNGVDNEVLTQNFTSRFQLFTNFKKSNAQFGIDYNFIQRKVVQSISDFSNTSQNHQITLSVRGKSKTKFKWDIGFIIDNQVFGFATNVLYFLNTNVQYDANKNLKLFINGNNMLNLNQSTLLTNSTTSSFFTTSRISIRPGYLMLGANYSL